MGNIVLIADSGSTKTHWIFIDGKKIINSIFTEGINPYFMGSNEISTLVETKITAEINPHLINSIYFYAAGCSLSSKQEIVKNGIHKAIPNATIQVDSDLKAAAIGLFGMSSGIACILGTGSNSGIWDGKQIVSSPLSLGFIFGDEGGGVNIGFRILKAYLKNELAVELKNDLENIYHLTPSLILEKVYSEPFPNRYLASFAPFASGHINVPVINKIVKDSFSGFFCNNLMKYPELNKNPIGFIGSIAFHFSEQLHEIANQNNVNNIKIISSPMNGLIDYHCLKD